MENNENNNSITKLQCLMHQKVLYTKVASSNNMMDIVGKDYKLYFVTRIESSIISPITLRSRESAWGLCFTFAM